MTPLETTWNRFERELKAFVYRRVNDRSLAEDIVQDVFLKVHSKLDQLKESEKIAGWIFQIAKNTIVDYFRSNARKAIAVEIDWDADQSNLNDCVSSCLNEMLHTLPDKYREALEMAEVKDMSQLELAEALNISYSGAKSRVQRARRMLKEKMDEHYRIKLDAYGNVVVCENKGLCACGSEA
jgi:RNA polymerase sigma-70 factor, ECF subfamily